MEILFWHWLILGVVLVAAEAAVPGAFLIWLGIAALLTGGVSALTPSWSWESHALIFAGLAIATALLGQRLYRRWNPDTRSGRDTLVNRGAERYLGTLHVLSAPLLGGEGRMKVGDGTWKVFGPDLDTGTHVRVIAVEGIALRVEEVKEP